MIVTKEVQNQSAGDLSAIPAVVPNLIGGADALAMDGRTFAKLDPATGREVCRVARSSAADVALAVEAAKRAQPAWAALTVVKRGDILRQIALLMRERRSLIADLVSRETGKSKKDALGETDAAIEMGFFVAGEGRRYYGQTTTSAVPHKAAMIVRQPLGVAGLIIAANTPIANVAWKAFPALLCGNSAILKAAEDTPLSSYHLVQILTDAGLPAGVVNLVSGDGPNAGAPLASHSDVPVVSFTGSTGVGRLIAQACAPDFKHCSLEMGGKNIIIVMDDANLDLAVDGAIWGGFGTSGQRCTAASRIALHKSVYHEFISRFVARAKKLRVGNGLDADVDMGPCINEQQLKTVMDYVQIGKNEGAKLLSGGHRLTDGACAKGWFHEPTIFGDCNPRMRVAQEEIFGPVVSVVPIGSFEEAIEVANGVPYGLSASIYTRNVNRAFEATRDLFTGIVYINAPTIGAETHLPFGGTKQTGNGHREAAIAAIDFYTEWKTVYIDYSDKLQRAQIHNAE